VADPIPLRKAKEALAVGDVVSLKCGSEAMVVVGCKNGVATVAWHDDLGNPLEYEYPVEALEPCEVEWSKP